VLFRSADTLNPSSIEREGASAKGGQTGEIPSENGI
jgi:hypothetical protein